MLPKVEQALPRTSPEAQGIASAAVLQFVEALENKIHEIHSFMLLRHGNVVAEGWWSPYKREYPHILMSVSKSFTSSAVGIAVSEGRFSIDDPVLSFFPDEAPSEISEFLAAMQVRHLLSMSTGQKIDTIPAMFEQEASNWIKAFFTVPVLHAPGTHFVYNTGATYLLSAIVQKTSGMKLIDYLQTRLFEPLGIENATWEESPTGVSMGGFGLSVKTEDIARFGQLYLQKGMWQGQRLLSEAWIEEATGFQVSNGKDPDSDWAQGYGYQFWRCKHGAYRGDGAFGQYCIVMPEQNAVLAITGGLDDMQAPLNLVWDILLPAMKNEAPVEDAEAHKRLTEKLSTLSLLPVQGKAESPLTAQISERTYKVEQNALQLETIALNFTDSGYTVSVKTATREAVVSAGWNQWQPGETTLFNSPWQLDPLRVDASGAWTADDTFRMVVRLIETAFVHTLVCHFADNEMIIETWINVSFGSTKPILMTAKAI